MSEMVARLDDLGRPAWLAVMILGFIIFWPLGLATLAFMIWSGRMGCGRRDWAGQDPMARWENKMQRLQSKMEQWRERQKSAFAAGGPAYAGGFTPSGNRAFDEYRSETLKRLEEEAHEFRSFLDRLRHAKDKAEFDQFMAAQRNRQTPPPATPPAPDAAR